MNEDLVMNIIIWKKFLSYIGQIEFKVLFISFVTRNGWQNTSKATSVQLFRYYAIGSQNIEFPWKTGELLS